jgi:hypothetical protein
MPRFSGQDESRPLSPPFEPSSLHGYCKFFLFKKTKSSGALIGATGMLTYDAHSPDLHLQVNGFVRHHRALLRRDRPLTNHSSTASNRLVGAHPPRYPPILHYTFQRSHGITFPIPRSWELIRTSMLCAAHVDLSYLASAWLPSCLGVWARI